MRNIKKFTTESEYNEFKSVMVMPNIIYVTETQEEKIKYNPFIPVTGVTLNTNTLSFVGTGSTQNLTATVSPNNASIKKVSYASSDDSIATVTSGGVVTAVNYGDAIITVTTEDKGLTAQCEVNVAKNQGQVTTAPTAIASLVYNNTAQALVTAGVGTGTMMYKLDEGEWDTVIPTATNAGSYTVTYKASASTDYTESTTGSVNVSIAKVTPTVTAPTAKVLAYNGSQQELVNAGSTNFGTLQYNVSDGSWGTSIPTRQNTGSYVVGYKVVGDSNVNDITAQYINCSINEKQVTATVTLSQDTYTYDGSAKEPTVTVYDGGTVIDPSEYTVTYSNNINAGTGTVTIYDVTGGNYDVEGSATFTINKAAGSVTTVPTAKSLTYNGSAQELVNAGSGTGTMMYKLDNGSWGTSISTATNATSYTVYYKAAESANYNESASGSVVCSIGKADQSAPTATGATTTYNTTATATASGGGGQGSLEWYNGNTQTSVGSKTTKARWGGNSNYNASPYSNEVTLTMNKADQSAPTATGATVYYGNTATATASGGGKQGSLEWSNGNTRTALGSQSTSARWGGNGNYNASSWSNSVTLTVNDPYVGHAYVEIDGLKWATMNVGASSVTDNGLYFAWGEIQGYTANQVTAGTRSFTWKTYKYGNGTSSPGSTGMTKYNSTDSKTVLDASDDAAQAAWGGAWRMPTTAEFQALGTATTSAWTADYGGSGVAGLVLTSKADSSKKLFFPAAGSCSSSSVLNVGSNGNYWSSSLYSLSKTNAYYLYFDNSDVNWRSSYYRCFGRAVRPVVG